MRASSDTPEMHLRRIVPGHAQSFTTMDPTGLEIRETLLPVRRPAAELVFDIKQAVHEDSEEEDDFIYNPLKLPMGWDGKPIPYWLYKLHGLNQVRLQTDRTESSLWSKFAKRTACCAGSAILLHSVVTC